MTWFDSTTPYEPTTSRSAADRLSHTEDAGGSTPPSSTVAEVEVDDTPGCEPGGSRFESGRSPQRTAGDLGSARSHTPCPRVRFPPGPLTHGPVANGSDELPRSLARGLARLTELPRSLARGLARLTELPRSLARGLARLTHADVAQLGEARRSDRRQCRFESDRQYHLDVATAPDSAMRGGGTGTTPGSEPGGPRSNRGLAAIDVSAERSTRCVRVVFRDATFTVIKVLEDGSHATWPL